MVYKPVDSATFLKMFKDYINTYDQKNIQAFVTHILASHPAFHQIFTKLCMMWLDRVRNAPVQNACNEGSIKLANKIMDCLTPEDLELPLV